jgi:DNA-binding transcriptional LysR family regulator
VIDRAKQIVFGMAELKRSVDLLRGLQIGTLKVGVGPAMAESYVTEAVARVAEQHPRTQLRVRIDDWRQLSEWLLAGQIDLVVADIAEADGDERLECMPLPKEELVWFCRAGHPLAGRSRIARSDLLEFPLATPRMPRWAVDWFAEAGSHGHLLPSIQCENYSFLKRIVRSSSSISAAQPATIRAELEEKRVVVLPVDAPKLTTHAGIMRLRGRTSSPLALELIHMIQSMAVEPNLGVEYTSD